MRLLSVTARAQSCWRQIREEGVRGQGSLEGRELSMMAFIYAPMSEGKTRPVVSEWCAGV
jgi:hypothetical protein